MWDFWRQWQPAEGAAQRDEMIAGQLGVIGLATAGGEICGSVLQQPTMESIRQSYPEMLHTNRNFRPERENQIMSGLIAGRLVLRSLPEAERCKFVHAWFGPRGSMIENLLAPR